MTASSLVASAPGALRGALHGERVTVGFPGLASPVLDAIDFHLELGAGAAPRIGVTGPNGHGKTTLLRLLFGELGAESGVVQRPWAPGAAPVAWLPQGWEASALGLGLREFVESSATALRALASELVELEGRMASAAGEALDAVLARYGEVQARYEALDGYGFEARVERVTGGLGLAGLDPSTPLGSLSSGERTRAALARLLLTPAAVRVLDEPTNHLDVEGIRWLEGFLGELEGVLFVSSHDRTFLDAVVDTIWHVESGELTCFAGNWTAFAAHRAAERARQAHQHAVQQREIGRLEDALRERLAWSHARERDKYGPDVFDRGFIGACAARHAKRAKAVRGRIERELEERRAEKVWVDAAPAFSLPSPQGLPEVVLSARGVSVQVGARVLFEGLDLDVRRGARVALVGPNGCGKSTLLRVLGGECAASSGTVWTASRVGVHRVEQELGEGWAGEETVLGLLGAGPGDAQVRTLLGCLGLGGELAMRALSALSPGQRCRVAIAAAVRAGAGLLLLDEPTNHLDLAAREALEGALRDWSGAVVVVSHDRRFVEALGCTVVAPWLAAV